MARYNPYQMALGRQDEVIDTLNRIVERQEQSAARQGKISALKGELEHEQREKYKKIEEEVKKSQRKAKRGGLFRKLLKVAGLFMGPLGAGLTSGIAGMDAARRQKGALKHLAKALEKHGEFSTKMRGKGAGLRWLSNPMKQFTENVMSGKRDVEKSASKINPLKAGLTAGLTSALTAKMAGKEGMFGGGKLRAIKAGDVALKDALSKQFLPGHTPKTLTYTPGTLGSLPVKDSFGNILVPGVKGTEGVFKTVGQSFADYAKTAEGAKALTSLLPQLTGAFEEEPFELPSFGRPIY